METLPLYLDSKELLMVSYEPPALCIQHKNRSDQLFPLRKIARIQVSGPVEWQSAALIACMKQGISIQFLDKNGDTIGRVVGTGQHSMTLNQYFEHLFYISHWQEKYLQWCDAKTQQSRRYAAITLKMPFNCAQDLKFLENWSRYRLNQYPLKQLSQFYNSFYNDLLGEVNNYLQYHCLWKNTSVALNEPIDLATDLTNIMAPVIIILREQILLSQKSYPEINKKQLSIWFMQKNKYIHYQIIRMVNMLEIWIRSL
jgi:hypothetical protein